jgi:7-carboxy-7-deazaguanine synthase
MQFVERAASGIARTAVCQFCDTDFVGTDGDGGGKFASGERALAAAVAAKWGGVDEERTTENSERRREHREVRGEGRRFVVCTGGEPLLQLDGGADRRAARAEVHRLRLRRMERLRYPRDVDWVCVSPKANAELVVDARQ